MLNDISAALAERLRSAGINAVADFSGGTLDPGEPIVSVGIKSALLSSAGIGNYIGICTESGEVTEMYGEKADIVFSVDVYSPKDDDRGMEYIEAVRRALYKADGLTVRELKLGQTQYDGKSRMLVLRCDVASKACLVRRVVGSALSAYKIGED